MFAFCLDKNGIKIIFASEMSFSPNVVKGFTLVLGFWYCKL